VNAAPPFPRGDVLISTMSSDTELLITNGAAITDDLVSSFTVPSGKTANVIATYNVVAGAVAGGCAGELHIDSPNGTILNPGEFPLNGAPGANTTSLNGFVSGIAPGTHSVYIRLRSIADPPTSDIDCYIGKRSLILIVRIQ